MSVGHHTVKNRRGATEWESHIVSFGPTLVVENLLARPLFHQVMYRDVYNKSEACKPVEQRTPDTIRDVSNKQKLFLKQGSQLRYYHAQINPNSKPTPTFDGMTLSSLALAHDKDEAAAWEVDLTGHSRNWTVPGVVPAHKREQNKLKRRELHVLVSCESFATHSTLTVFTRYYLVNNSLQVCMRVST